MNLLTFFSYVLIGNLVVVNCIAATDNPCDGGQLFDLVCKMLKVMKKDAETGKKQLETRFKILSEMQNINKKEHKADIEQESKRLLLKQTNDVKMLVQMIEQKIKNASFVLQHKVNQNQKDMDLRVKAILNTSEANLYKFEQEVRIRMKNNTSVFKQAVQELEYEMDQDNKVLRNEIQAEKVIVVKGLETKISSLKSDYEHSITSVQNMLLQQVQQNQRQIQELNKKYNDQVNAAKWPKGKYCILNNGVCPPGFTSIQGYMRAINMYSANGIYIKPAYFGSSSITCHGKCGQYGNWVGELLLSTCCK